MVEGVTRWAQGAWWRPAVRTVAMLGPLLTCAVLSAARSSVTGEAVVLVPVLWVVAAASTGDRVAGVLVALSGAAWFDFFLTEPYSTFTIDDPDDIEAAVLLVVIGLAVTEVALWGRRQQAPAARRAGYLDGVIGVAHSVAEGDAPSGSVAGVVAHQTAAVLGAASCQYVDGPVQDGRVALLDHERVLTRAGRVVDVDRAGLSTDEYVAVEMRRDTRVVGHFLGRQRRRWHTRTASRAASRYCWSTRWRRPLATGRHEMSMTVRLVTVDGVERHPGSALPGLLARGEGIVWVDIPEPDEHTAQVLAESFDFHPLAIKDAMERNRVPKAHAYADHVFFVLHKPERGERGHVHYIELDLFVGVGYLVTVHGPVNPKVDPSVAVRETEAVLERLEEGRLRPNSAFELSHAIVSALVRQQHDFVESVTGEVWRLEQQVTTGRPGDPEDFVEELFGARHGLLAVRTMARHSTSICASIGSQPRISDDGRRWATAMAADFDMVQSVADGEREYLQGVIDFYQTVLALRASLATQQQNLAAAELTRASYRQNEDLKKISGWAAILFAPTLVGTIYGMNFDHIPELNWVWGYPAALIMMAATSILLYGLFHRRGWL